jgi:hypothetical protein
MNGWTLRSAPELAHERMVVISKDFHDENKCKYLERLPVGTSKAGDRCLKKFSSSDLNKECRRELW